MVSTCFNVVCLSYYGCFSGQDLVNVRIDYRCPFKFPISWTPFIPVSPKMPWPEGLYPWQLELSFFERWIILKEVQCNVGQMSPMIFGSDSALIWFISYSYIIFTLYCKCRWHCGLDPYLLVRFSLTRCDGGHWCRSNDSQWGFWNWDLAFVVGTFLWDRKWCNWAHPLDPYMQPDDPQTKQLMRGSGRVANHWHNSRWKLLKFCDVVLIHSFEGINLKVLFSLEITSMTW